jgi:putative acetyltransferase
MHIRKAVKGDIDELKELYHDTITTINKRDYREEQIKAWASTKDRTEGFMRRISEHCFLIAENSDHKITGFASLEKTGYLDLLYVHKDFQGIGVAKLLLQKIIDTARELNIPKLETDASITAKPFFEKFGFRTVRQQTVSINNVQLINYKMEKVI